MAQKRILVVDDEPKIAGVVKLYLEREGFQVITAGDGKQALEKASASPAPDLVVLDLNLPDKDGLEVFRQIRRQSSIPVIMLTGRGEEIDRIVGLELGADDYMVKPFSPRELVARVRAVMRRGAVEQEQGDLVKAGDLQMDMARFEATCKGHKLELTTTEFKLLSALAKSPGRVYSRMQLLDIVQGEAFEGYERTIDAHIKNIRQKVAIHTMEHNCRIETIRGVGYKLEVNPNEA